MSGRIIHVAENFWNIRGSFRIAGLIDVGTQMSLVRTANGKFAFLDSYTPGSTTRRKIDDLTNGGQDVEAIINLHPFHTVHVKAMHQSYPHARLYGTARHVSRAPQLPWQDLRSEDPELHEMFSDDFEFSVPRGVDFISANENVHFSSVMILHKASQTIHVDDTVMYIRMPGLLRFCGLGNRVGFHPTLGKALEKRAGAAQDFRQWAEELTEKWRHAENLCAAHTATLTADRNSGDSIHTRLVTALAKVAPTLDAHERRYG